MTSWDPDNTTEQAAPGPANPPVRPTPSVFDNPNPAPPASSQLPPRQDWPPAVTRPIPTANPTTPITPAPTPTYVPAPAPAFQTPQATAPLGGATAPPSLTPQPIPTPQEKKPVGWFWPALGSFIVGGLLVGIGFRVGTQSQTVAAVPTTTFTTAAPREPLPPAVNTDADPASFVAQVLGPSVVTVETDRGLGSGVIFDDGQIMTNNHVIEGAREINIRLSDGSLLPGDLVGADPRTDIAVVSVGPGRNLPEAELALGHELEVGQLAIAIGSPFELQQTVTAGIISALNRPVQNSLGFTAMIQTDAPINPGNSGGALADRQGRVIGINTAIQTAGEAANAGVGFAVPIDTAFNVSQRIIDGQPLVGGFLGVGGVGQDGSSSGASGVEVGNITADSAADIAGVTTGDRIIAVDGAPVTNLEQLAGIVSTRFPGDRVEITLVRDDETLVLIATLGER